MTERIRMEIDDATSPGMQSIDKNLGQINKAADSVEKSLNEAAKSANNLGIEGKKAGNNSGLAITELNQGLELAKKAAELLSRGFSALAADGSPAFQRLQSSVSELQGALLDLANDPAIQEWVDQLAEKIKTDLIPTVNSIPDYWRGTQTAAAYAMASSLEAIGVFTEGASDTLQQMQKEQAATLEQQAKAVELERQREAGQGRIQKIQEQVAEQDRLMSLAKQTDLMTVNDLLYEEQENLKLLARQGRATKQEQEESSRRITLLEKRRLEIPREQAEAAKRAAEEEAKAAERLSQDRQKAAEEAAKAEEDYQRKLQAADEAAQKSKADEVQKWLGEIEKKKQELVSLIQQAQGADGKNLLETTRQQIDPRRIREQLANQAEAEARANFVFKGDDASKVGAAREAAAKQARMQAFRDFNAGRTSQADIAGAQNTLIQNSVQQAQGRGDLDQQTATALMQAAQNQQNIIATQERQAQQMKQIQAVLGQAGNASGRSFAASRRSLMGN